MRILLAAYEAGEIMGISRIQAQDMGRVRANPDLQLLSARLSGYSLIFVNLDNPETPFFQDRRVRQALDVCPGPAGAGGSGAGRPGLVIHSPIMPQSWAYKADIKQYAHDPAQAKALLEQAGWKYCPARELGS